MAAAAGESSILNYLNIDKPSELQDLEHVYISILLKQLSHFGHFVYFMKL